MGKVVGIGGVFLGLKGDDQQLRDWYEEHLQLDMTPYGTGFITGDQMLLVSFTRTENSTSPYINFRVDNLDEIINYLSNQGCKIISKIEEHIYGKFARFEDPFSNNIELWEPYEEQYTSMVRKEILDYQKKKSNK